jgi:hypothetical protein
MSEAPKRRWFQDGLLAKANPRATRASVARHGAAWAAVGAIGYWACVYFQDWSTDHWLAKTVSLAIFLGLIGMLCEWQIDDSEDDRLPPNSTTGQ